MLTSATGTAISGTIAATNAANSSAVFVPFIREKLKLEYVAFPVPLVPVCNFTDIALLTFTKDAIIFSLFSLFFSRTLLL